MKLTCLPFFDTGFYFLLDTEGDCDYAGIEYGKYINNIQYTCRNRSVFMTPTVAVDYMILRIALKLM